MSERAHLFNYVFKVQTHRIGFFLQKNTISYLKIKYVLVIYEFKGRCILFGRVSSERE